MSDRNTEYTDSVLLDLEGQITRIYTQATDDVQKKLDSYLAKFAQADERQRERLRDGIITRDEYSAWRVNQLLVGERWANLRDTLANDLVNADILAMERIKGTFPSVFAESFNFGTYQVESQGVNTSFTLYDRDAVMRLFDEVQILPDPTVDIPKDFRWNSNHIQGALMQGILQGESIPNLSKRLQSVTNMDRNSAVRNARTMVTSAQNAGRLESYKRAESMGIPMMKQWLSANDRRTRASHQMIDGEEVPVREEFSNGLMYPADPDGDPEEVYNCRCTLIADVDVESIGEGSPLRDDVYEDIDYDDWEESKVLSHELINRASRVEEGVSSALRSSVNLSQGHLEGYDFRFKGASSLERKLITKSNLKGISMADYAKGVTDVLRYTSVSHPDTFTRDFFRITENLEKRGFRMIEVVNTMASTNAPYRGINTLVQTPDGYIFELQFHTGQSIEIKEFNHKLYEEARLADTPQDRKNELDRMMMENAKSIVTPVGSDTIRDKYIDSTGNP